MPTVHTRPGTMNRTGLRALFVVSVLFLSMILSTVSSVAAYAQQPELEEDAVTQIQEEPQEESTEEVEEPIVEEVVSVVDINEEETDVVEQQLLPSLVIPEPEFDIDADFVCWLRTGLQTYSFTIEYDGDEYDIEPGETGNTASPSKYESLLPSEFEDDEYLITIENWDGDDFTWMLGNNIISISQENEKCDAPTIGDVIVEEANIQVLEDFIVELLESKQCRELGAAFDAEAGPFTVFAPTNSAFAHLISAPATLDNELNQLLGNPDELCALIGSHIVLGEYTSADVPNGGVTLDAVANDLDGIFVQKKNGKVYVDGAKVVKANLFGVNGVVHIIDGVLLPQSVGTINQIETNKTSPMLSGSINLYGSSEYAQMQTCVVVRIDGVPYIADVTGNTWTIPEGVVTLNPTKTTTLFDVIVRSGFYDIDSEYDHYGACENPEERYGDAAVRAQSLVDVVTHGGRLLGLTMTNNVVSFEQPEEPSEPENNGRVLGTTTEKVEGPVVVAASVCTKGVCGDEFAQADPSTIDSDGDGVVDSEDPEPFNPDVSGQEDDADTDNAANTDEQSESEEDDSNTNVFVWLLAGGAVAVIWYLLWQRSGRENG